MKLSISQLTTLRWSIEEDVAAYRDFGFGAIGLWRPKLDDLGVEKADELLNSYDMKVSSLSWAGGFTGSDGRGHNDAIIDGIEALRAADRLGAETLIVLAGGYNNHIQGHAMRLLLQGLEALAHEAESTNVRVALEPIHPGCGDEWSFIGDLQATLEVINKLPFSDIGLVLDAYHLAVNATDSQDLGPLNEILPLVRLVQLGDARHTPLGEQNRCLLGEGRVPLQPLIHQLCDAGYDGYFEVELLGQDVEPLPYEQVLDHTRRYLVDLAGSVS